MNEEFLFKSMQLFVLLFHLLFNTTITSCNQLCKILCFMASSW